MTLVHTNQYASPTSSAESLASQKHLRQPTRHVPLVPTAVRKKITNKSHITISAVSQLGDPPCSFERRIDQRIEQFEISNRLGSGGFGDVYRARRILIDSKSEPVALKFVATPTNESIVQSTEVRAHLRSGRHKNIAALRDVLDLPVGMSKNTNGKEEKPVQKKSILVYEFVNGICLTDAFSADNGCLSEALALRIGVQLCRALCHLHSQGVAHMDIKPDNIMLDMSDLGRDFMGMTTKLVDLGLAMFWDVDNAEFKGVRGKRGTHCYMAPEVQKDIIYIPALADVYSLGLVLYEMLCGLRSNKPLISYNATRRWDVVPEDLKKLVTRCLKKSWCRPTMGEVLNELEIIAKRHAVSV